jgi:hypothetical protein
VSRALGLEEASNPAPPRSRHGSAFRIPCKQEQEDSPRPCSLQ